MIHEYKCKHGWSLMTKEEREVCIAHYEKNLERCNVVRTDRELIVWNGKTFVPLVMCQEGSPCVPIEFSGVDPKIWNGVVDFIRVNKSDLKDHKKKDSSRLVRVEHEDEHEDDDKEEAVEYRCYKVKYGDGYRRIYTREKFDKLPDDLLFGIICKADIFIDIKEGSLIQMKEEKLEDVLNETLCELFGEFVHAVDQKKYLKTLKDQMRSDMTHEEFCIMLYPALCDALEDTLPLDDTRKLYRAMLLNC